MNLQKKLINLSEYKCSFKYVDSYFLVSVTYPETWSIIPSEDRSIEVAEEDGVTFYAAPIETEIEKAFNLIDDTIAYNLDVEKKLALLKYNIGKLQELFAEKDLEELETIDFVFKPKKTTNEKTTKKSIKKTRKKTVQKDVENVVDEKYKQTEEFKDEYVDPFKIEPNNEFYFDGEKEPINLEVSNDKTNKYLEEVER